jgi:hypothetical protein
MSPRSSLPGSAKLPLRSRNSGRCFPDAAQKQLGFLADAFTRLERALTIVPMTGTSRVDASWLHETRELVDLALLGVRPWLWCREEHWVRKHEPTSWPH